MEIEDREKILDFALEECIRILIKANELCGYDDLSIEGFRKINGEYYKLKFDKDSEF